MSEQLRKEFEAWARNHYYLQELSFEREAGGDYSEPEMEAAWEVWQAAKTEPEREVEPVAWIPVSERLPKPYEEIRFYPPIDTGTKIDRGIFDNEGRCWFDDYLLGEGSYRVRHNRVSHWQPITEPKEQSE